MAGPTGGFLVGFAAAAFVTGWLAENGWKEPVRLVGIADSILRAPTGAHYCAIELKLGRCAPVIDTLVKTVSVIGFCGCPPT